MEQGLSNLLTAHIVAGAVALASGTAAIFLKKGARAHRATGTAYFVFMLIMAVTGFALALQNPNAFFLVIALIAAYLVATGWATARRADGVPGVFEAVMLVYIAVVAAAAFAAGMWGAALDAAFLGGPPGLFFAFAGEAALFAAFDASVLIRRGVAGAQRIARHLWRMILGLNFAAVALFLGNPQIFPDKLQGSFVLFLPVLVYFALMGFWLIRVLTAREFQRR